MYLYVIEDARASSSWLKIGRTYNPIKRLTTYNSSFPDNPISYIYLSTQIKDAEKAEVELTDFLVHFGTGRPVRAKFEWFKPSGKHGGKNRLAQKIIKQIKKLEIKYKI